MDALKKSVATNGGNGFLLCSLVLFFFTISNMGLHLLLLSTVITVTSIFVFGARFFKECYFVLFIFYALLFYSLFFIDYELAEHLYLASFFYALNAFLCVCLITRFPKEIMLRAIFIVASLHVSLIVFQHIHYFVLSSYLDMHNIISLGKYTSRFESAFMGGVGLIRPTGFAVEPSNASSVVLFLIISYLAFGGVRDKKLYLLLMFNCLTFSFAIILISSLILIFLYIQNEGKKLLLTRLPGLLFLACIAFYGFYIVYLRVTAGLDYDAISFREVIFEVFNKQSLQEHFFGHGIIMAEVPLTIHDVVIYQSNIRDSGFFVNLYFTFGLLGLLLFSLYFYFKFKSKIMFLIFFTSLLSKFDYMQPIFWFMIFSIVVSCNQKGKI